MRPERLTNGGLRVARRAAAAAFLTTDPSEPLFRDSLPERAILYPVAYTFDEEKLAALAAAAAEEEDSRFFLMLREETGEPVFDLAFDDYESYSELDLYTEVVMYGPSGRWGMVVSHIDYAVVGGSARFLATLRRRFPPVEPYHEEGAEWTALSFEGQVVEFVADLFGRVPVTNVPWLRPLLAHVYGEPEADRLMRVPPAEDAPGAV